MKKTQKHFRAVVVAGVAVGALAIVFVAARSHEAGDDEVVRGQIRDLREKDALLDARVLAARLSLLPHHDPIVETLDALRRTSDALRSGRLGALAKTEPSIERALARFDQRLGDKANLVEDLKSQIAVRTNSARYLPMAFEEAKGAAGKLPPDLSEPAVSEIATLQRAAFQDVLAPTPASRETLASIGRKILGEPYAGFEELRRAARHAEVVHSTGAQLDDKTQEYLAVDTRGAIDELWGAYSAHVEELDRLARLLTIALFVGTCLLVVYIVYVLRRMARITRSAHRFMPRAFLDLLGLKSHTDVMPGVAIARNMSVLFADIRGFTTMSELRNHHEMFALVHRFHAAMDACIRAHRGFVNQFLGDGVMALFDGDGDVRADSAVDAAVAMHAALREMNAARAKAGEGAIQMGTGINTGRLMLGTIGSGERTACGVISDVVNVAARVEGLTKELGARVLITEHTFHDVKNASRFELRMVDRVPMKGRQMPVTIYEVLDAEEPALRDAKRATQARLKEAILLYLDRRFAEALPIFRECSDRAPDDRVPQVYVERCTRMLESPPPIDWSGGGDAQAAE